ncbi:hypothetical protein [Nocardia xishanensis]|uniref:Heavy-metal-associated domain-containing protein n=1 Tax=Nocardia xishanensis TaxID=238964 RepID=A0ABW7WYX9_9NOCA
MRDRLRFAAFGGGLVVLLGAALGIGALVGDPSERGVEHSGVVYDGSYRSTGLSDSESGYTLADLSAPASPNRAGPLSFRITGPDGAPVTRFAVRHEKPLHLVVARSDGAEYRHTHPAMAADGTWSVEWTWAAPGTYRVFADFAPETGDGSNGLVLSRTVTVAGDAAARPLPPAAETASVDGYQVRLQRDSGDLRFTVTRDGGPVTDLEPYLGAYAHLVGLHAPSLAYLHAHPQGEVGRTSPGPEVAFHAEPPVPGPYRLYFEFAHGGSVHTAEFTLEFEPLSTTPSTSGAGHHSGGEHR